MEPPFDIFCVVVVEDPGGGLDVDDPERLVAHDRAGQLAARNI